MDKRSTGWRVARWATIGMLLLLPLVAMQFTTEVAWDTTDFALAAVLLIGGGAIYEVAATASSSHRHRHLIGTGLVAIVLIVWAQGAVGIF
jgi:hypothetical protein